jgi:hypothetical protein
MHRQLTSGGQWWPRGGGGASLDSPRREIMREKEVIILPIRKGRGEKERTRGPTVFTRKVRFLRAVTR